MFISIDPASAAKRAALIADGRSDGRASHAAAFGEFLHATFGFDVILWRRGDEISLEAATDRFRRSLQRTGTEDNPATEFAFVFVAGHFEHNSEGTFGTVGERRDDVLAVHHLIDYMVQKASRSLAMFERLDGTRSRGADRYPGFGRMPVLSEQRLLVSLVSEIPTISGGHPTLASILVSNSNQLSLRPSDLVTSVRQQLYLGSAGFSILRNIGNLPLNLWFERAHDRKELVSSFKTTLIDICKLAASESHDAAAAKLFRHYRDRVGLRQNISLSAVDTFSLATVHRLLRSEPKCPIRPMPPSTGKVPATAAITPDQQERSTTGSGSSATRSNGAPADDRAEIAKPETKEPGQARASLPLPSKQGSGLAAKPPAPQDTSEEAKRSRRTSLPEPKEEEKSPRKKETIRDKVRRRTTERERRRASPERAPPSSSRPQRPAPQQNRPIRIPM